MIFEWGEHMCYIVYKEEMLEIPFKVKSSRGIKIFRNSDRVLLSSCFLFFSASDTVRKEY
jgi:hypothetical protein